MPHHRSDTKLGLYRNVLYTPEETARVLGVSMRTVSRLVAEGVLKPRRIRNVPRFYGADLISYLGIPSEDVPIKEDGRWTREEEDAGGQG